MAPFYLRDRLLYVVWGQKVLEILICLLFQLIFNQTVVTVGTNKCFQMKLFEYFHLGHFKTVWVWPLLNFRREFIKFIFEDIYVTWKWILATLLPWPRKITLSILRSRWLKTQILPNQNVRISIYQLLWCKTGCMDLHCWWCSAELQRFRLSQVCR